MKEDNKTVTMLLSEYRRMEEELANRNLQKELTEEERKAYECKVSELKESCDHWRYCYIEATIKNRDLEQISKELGLKVQELEEELAKYKQKKWYEFWK